MTLSRTYIIYFDSVHTQTCPITHSWFSTFSLIFFLEDQTFLIFNLWLFLTEEIIYVLIMKVSFFTFLSIIHLRLIFVYSKSSILLLLAYKSQPHLLPSALH